MSTLASDLSQIRSLFAKLAAIFIVCVTHTAASRMGAFGRRLFTHLSLRIENQIQTAVRRPLNRLTIKTTIATTSNK
jgi:hypothetical protein